MPRATPSMTISAGALFIVACHTNEPLAVFKYIDLFYSSPTDSLPIFLWDALTDHHPHGIFCYRPRATPAERLSLSPRKHIRPIFSWQFFCFHSDSIVKLKLFLFSAIPNFPSVIALAPYRGILWNLSGCRRWPDFLIYQLIAIFLKSALNFCLLQR